VAAEKAPRVGLGLRGSGEQEGKVVRIAGREGPGRERRWKMRLWCGQTDMPAKGRNRGTKPSKFIVVSLCIVGTQLSITS